VDDPRYPIGAFRFSGKTDTTSRARCIAEIAAAPGHLRAAVSGLTPAQLDTPYREGGWSVRQVVHHLPDSHLNAYIRFKLALTEHEPTIKPYAEARWAELSDVWTTPTDTSLTLLECLHRRWVLLLRDLQAADFSRTFRHPEQGRTIELDEVLEMYAWHGKHHVAQITSLRSRMGWI
jgi:uncharacterized damage-inducible protein DinB